MMRTILIDDEPIILEELKYMLESNEKIQVVGTYIEPLEALQGLSETNPDCVFLDIEMPNLNGIELAEKLLHLKPDMEILFVTAYNNYAEQAFEVNAIDYILKPIRQERLDKALNRIFRKINNRPNLGALHCTIRSFGSFEVSCGNRFIKWKRSKSKEFLAYMLQQEGNWVTKYKLCDIQWSECSPKQALAYLQTSVYALRKSLSEIGCMQIEIEYADDRYRVRIKEMDWDVRNFERDYQRFHSKPCLETAQQALSFYRGEYLEGEDWLWSDLVRENYICMAEELEKFISVEKCK